MAGGSHVAVIFDRRRQPPKQFHIFGLTRGREGYAFMGSWSAEGFLEREVSDQEEFAEMRLGDRADFERQRILLGGAPHVVQLEVAAQRDRPIRRLGDSEM